VAVAHVAGLRGIKRIDFAQLTINGHGMNVVMAGCWSRDIADRCDISVDAMCEGENGALIPVAYRPDSEGQEYALSANP
jgi:hypothetical protein